MKIGLRILVISAVLSLFCIPAAALAQPVVPLLYHGSVTIDGLDAPTGTIVTAEIDGAEVATNAPDGTTEVGTYTLDIAANEGDTVVLKVWGEVGGETTHPNPMTTFEVTLDLSVGEISLMPVAAFSASPLSGEEPLTVVFTDESQNMTNNPTWSWDFGDGGTSTEASPTHQYLEAGSYTVTLTVTTDEGTDGEVKVDYITVLAEDAFDPYEYDTDGTPGISKAEALAAVADYPETISKNNLLKVIKLYFG